MPKPTSTFATTVVVATLVDGRLSSIALFGADAGAATVVLAGTAAADLGAGAAEAGFAVRGAAGLLEVPEDFGAASGADLAADAEVGLAEAPVVVAFFMMIVLFLQLLGAIALPTRIRPQVTARTPTIAIAEMTGQQHSPDQPRGKVAGGTSRSLMVAISPANARATQRHVVAFA